MVTVYTFLNLDPSKWKVGAQQKYFYFLCVWNLSSLSSTYCSCHFPVGSRQYISYRNTVHTATAAVGIININRMSLIVNNQIGAVNRWSLDVVTPKKHGRHNYVSCLYFEAGQRIGIHPLNTRMLSIHQNPIKTCYLSS